MTSVLGIDAAWIHGNPSGVALVVHDGARWTCKAVSPSYAGFVGSRPTEVCWGKPAGGEAEIPELIRAAAELAGGRAPTVVAVDMPLSTEPIIGRRSADRETSRSFGRFACAVHSPTAARPGKVGERLTMALKVAGYPLATATTDTGTRPATIEVYPHAAIVRLMGLKKRLKYKVSRSRRLWPEADIQRRVANLICAFRELKHALDSEIAGIDLTVPDMTETTRLSHLKPYEDGLDALVCAWTGICYIENRAQALGDETSAIWIPTV